ncbi:MAG TPA: NUDIX hydrolase [Candidatus Saccharimonadales bacterium]
MSTKFNVGVKAIIEHDGKYLLLKKDDFWDTPGGRIDGDETVEEALRRELSEELPGCKNAQIGKLLNAVRLPGLRFGDHGLFLIWYYVRVDFPDGVKISDEHETYKWCTPEEVRELASTGIAEAVQSV